MSSFEWNKIFGAVLTLAFVVLGVTFLADGIFHSETPEKQGYAIEGGTSHGKEAVAEKTTAPTVEPVAALLASVDLAKGKKVAKKCAACHTFNEGGGKKVGPPLYDIVNRAIASFDGFGYSGALKTYGKDKTWTYAELNGFLYKPKAHVKGTSMGFSGIKKIEQRAALIGYLRTLAATPADLPEG